MEYDQYGNKAIYTADGERGRSGKMIERSEITPPDKVFQRKIKFKYGALSAGDARND